MPSHVSGISRHEAATTWPDVAASPSAGHTAGVRCPGPLTNCRGVSSLPAEATAVLFSAPSLIFFSSQHDNSLTAALSLMKFYTNIYHDNLQNTTKYQDRRSNVKVACFFLACMILLQPVGLNSRNVIR